MKINRQLKNLKKRIKELETETGKFMLLNFSDEKIIKKRE